MRELFRRGERKEVGLVDWTRMETCDGRYRMTIL